jgi:membrane carboxypeptidase/penicillin-binding protein PbpC
VDERSVFSEETSWLVMDALSDPDARRPMFGWDLPVDLPYPVVAKTGTAEGFGDTVAVLATADVIVGAWTGRFDGGSTQGRAAMATAAPLARAALLLSTRGRAQTLPPRPDGLEAGIVCPLSGLAPGPHCPHHRHGWFGAGRVPTTPCEWHGADGEVRWPDALTGWARRAGRVAHR